MDDVLISNIILLPCKESIRRFLIDFDYVAFDGLTDNGVYSSSLEQSLFGMSDIEEVINQVVRISLWCLFCYIICKEMYVIFI